MKKHIFALAALLTLATSAFPQTPSTPGQPLSIDTSGAVKRSLKIPTAKILTLQSGSTLAIDDGTIFSFGGTAATAMRTAIGDLNGTKVFTNSANRTASVPAFVGQFGFQTDTGTLYMSNGTTAGAWTSALFFDSLEVLNGTYTNANASNPGVSGISAQAAQAGVKATNSSSGPSLELVSSAGDLVTSTKFKIDVLGNLLANFGTVAAPGLSFLTDTDSGLYRSAANTIGVAANGANVATFGTTGLSLVTPLPVTSGGTGSASASAARTALSVSSATSETLITNQVTLAAGYYPAATFTANARNKVILNTEVYDPDGLTTFSDANDNFSIDAAGTYRIEVRVKLFDTGSTVLILRNSTDSTDLASTFQYVIATPETGGEMGLFTRVTLAGAKTYEVQIVPQSAGYQFYCSGALTLPTPTPTVQVTTIKIVKE